MKKLSRIVLLLLLVFPFVVKADVGAPQLLCFDVIVNNPEGAVSYEYNNNTKKLEATDKIIAKDTVLSICNEEKQDGELYLAFWNDAWRASGNVKKSDVLIKGDNELTPTYFLEKQVDLYVVTDDAYMFKGPSYSYDKVTEESIPKGSTVKLLAYDDEESVFAYVEYNGKKGWVLNSNWYADSYGENSKFAKIDNEKIFTIKQSIKLYNDPTNKNDYITLNESLGTEFDTLYFYSTDDNYYGIKYNNEIKWVILGEDVETTKELKGIGLYPIDYYSDSNFTNKAGTISLLKEYTILQISDIEDNKVGYIRVDGKTYFVDAQKSYDKIYYSPLCAYLISLETKEVNYYKDKDLTEAAGIINLFDRIKIVGSSFDAHATFLIIEVNNQKYYLDTSKMHYGSYEYNGSRLGVNKIISTKPVTMYNKFTNSGNMYDGDTITIPANAEFFDLGYIKYGKETQDGHVVKYGDQYGVVAKFDYSAIKSEWINYCLEDPTVYVEPQEEPTTEVVNNVESKNNTIIICSIVGGVVALTAIVVIILINKKKKNKKEAEETKVEETIVPQQVDSFVPTDTVGVETTEPTEEVAQEEVQPVEPAVEDKKEE